ncbi:MAG: PD-(D/E)XK nuclease family protein [Endomicrobiia bacterium]
MENGAKDLIKFNYTTILGWSVSRYDKYLMCKRAYYYDYYGKYDIDFRDKIEKLKNLTSIALEQGNIVHDVIKILLIRLLQTEKPIDKEKFFDFTKRKTEEYVSRKNFMEIYYNILPKIDVEKIFLEVKFALENFLNSDRYCWILSKAIQNKNKWLIEPPGYGETRIGDLKAYCKVDFLFPVDDEIYIIDWKTGKRDEKKHKKQLLGYSLWANFHFKKESSKIFPIVAYMQPNYEELNVVLNEFDLEEFKTIVEKETRELYSMCSDIEKNIPKNKDEFTKTKNTKICSFCNYQELCK